MRRPLAISAAVLGGATLLGALASGPRSPAAEKGGRTVRVGLVDTLFHNDSEQQIQSMAGPFKSLLEEKAGIVGEVVLGGNPENLAAELKDGKVGLGVYNGFEFGWAKQKNADLKPLMVGVNRRPFVRVVVIVRKDEKMADTAGLKGKVLALSQLAREPERIFVERAIVGAGTKKEQWFSKISKPRTAQDALDYVDSKDADAAIVDEIDWLDYGKNFSKSSGRMRVLKQSEKFAPVTVAYQPGKLDQDTLNRIRDGMIEANKTERGRKLIDLCRLTGFAAVPADFDQLVAENVKTYPPLEKK